MATTSPTMKLNAMQMHLLRFFSERQVSEEETVELQSLIAAHYARKADERMEVIWQERGFNQQTMDDLLNAPLMSVNQLPSNENPD